jgi:hypothetical protein
MNPRKQSGLKRGYFRVMLCLASLLLSCGVAYYDMIHGNRTDLVLEAVSVIYNGNGNTAGTEPSDSNTYSYGDTVMVTGNFGGLEKSGSFKEWNTNADGSGTRYTMGDTFIIGLSDVVLYAIYHTAFTRLVMWDRRGEGYSTSQEITVPDGATWKCRRWT